MRAKATEVRPDLVVLEMASDLPAGLDTAEKLKRTLPHVPLFLFRSLGSPTQGSLPFLQGVGALAPALSAWLYFGRQPPGLGFGTQPSFSGLPLFGGLHVISCWRIGGERR